MIDGFSPGTTASSTTKPGRHDIAEIFLKVALNTIKIKSNQIYLDNCNFDMIYLINTSTYIIDTWEIIVIARPLVDVGVSMHSCLFFVQVEFNHQLPHKWIMF